MDDLAGIHVAPIIRVVPEERHQPETVPCRSHPFHLEYYKMKTMMTRVLRSIRDSRGATMAEYAILVAVIALVVILAARALGNSVSTKLGNAAAQIT